LIFCLLLRCGPRPRRVSSVAKSSRRAPVERRSTSGVSSSSTKAHRRMRTSQEGNLASKGRNQNLKVAIKT
jgi:hypothetical protein